MRLEYNYITKEYNYIQKYKNVKAVKVMYTIVLISRVVYNKRIESLCSKNSQTKLSLNFIT